MQLVGRHCSWPFIGRLHRTSTMPIRCHFWISQFSRAFVRSGYLWFLAITGFAFWSTRWLLYAGLHNKFFSIVRNPLTFRCRLVRFQLFSLKMQSNREHWTLRPNYKRQLFSRSGRIDRCLLHLKRSDTVWFRTSSFAARH